jgi:enoyl-[acyl-carrier protein] reductase III
MMTSNVLVRVIDAIEVVTRYPKEVLAPEADLENDLGIDSVKLVEILVALGKSFQLELVKQDRDPTVRTIQQVAEWIAKQLGSPADAQWQHQRDSAFAEVPIKPAAVSKSVATISSSSSPRFASLNGSESKSMNTDRVAKPNGAIKSDTNGRMVSERRFQSAPPNGEAQNHSAPHFPISDERSASHNRNEARHEADHSDSIPNQSLSLRGRVALVTGSGRGVGRTIARLLAKRGAMVIVNSFHSREAGESTTREIVEQGGKAIHLWGSVANPNHVDSIFDEIAHQVGQLDMLVCNASDGRIGSFAEIAAEDWERAFRTNVIGHYQCAMRASRFMQRQGGGSIVTMSSIAARRFVEGLGGQGVVKAAVESMTRHLACELAPSGIRVNCVSGGPVYGQVMSLYPESRATMNYWETLVLDGELCSPIDLANTVAFLLSDEARGVNGAVWNVDHGLSTRSHSRPLPKSKPGQLSPSSVS